MAYSVEDIQKAKRDMYDGASTTEDNRHSAPAYAVRERDHGWTPPSVYTWEEAKGRLVDRMASEPDRKFEIVEAGTGVSGPDRVCWKYSLSNPDYVLCSVAEVVRTAQRRGEKPDRDLMRRVEYEARVKFEFVRGYTPPAECLGAGTRTAATRELAETMGKMRDLCVPA